MNERPCPCKEHSTRPEVESIKLLPREIIFAGLKVPQIATTLIEHTAVATAEFCDDIP